MWGFFIQHLQPDGTDRVNEIFQLLPVTCDNIPILKKEFLFAGANIITAIAGPKR